MRTGLGWLRIGTGGGRLWVWWGTFGFHKTQGGMLPTKQNATCCTCPLPTYLDRLKSKPVTWVPVGLVCLLRWIRTLQEKCLFLYKNLKGCQTSFQNTYFFLCGCNYSYVYCQYNEVHHILYNLTNAVNKMQDYRIKYTQKNTSMVFH